MLDIGLYAGYVLIGVAIVSGLLMPLLQMLKSPRNLIKLAISVGLLAVVFFVAYALSGSEISASGKLMGVSEGSSKLIGAGLIMFYMTLIFAAIGVVFSEINKALK